VTNTTLTPKVMMLAQDEWMNQQPTGPRFMMWVDGVGGFLTCLSETVRIGQAVAGNRVELPIIGDLSRQHATITRQGEGYSIRPSAPTWVGGRAITEPRWLSDGDEVKLGSSFLMRFRQPHPLSATARLELISHHRTQPAADGVLLMATSCVLGPGHQNHVVCRQWAHDVVLVRQGQSLACHSARPFEVDGQPRDRRATITLNSRIQGEDFCLSLEQFD
jgi:hypothetical protein